MIYIVMTGVASSYSYDGTLWSVAEVFSTEESAKKYILQKKATYGSDVEYEIEVKELHA